MHGRPLQFIPNKEFLIFFGRGCQIYKKVGMNEILTPLFQQPKLYDMIYPHITDIHLFPI